METSVHMLSHLEGTRFSAHNDLHVLQAVIEFVFTQNKTMWTRGTPDRAKLLELITGKLILSQETCQKTKGLENLVLFVQGLVLLNISLVNGLGRSPMSIQVKDQTVVLKFANKPTPVVMTPGIYDTDMEKVIREFKQFFYGAALDAQFGKNECVIIKETLKETLARLKREKQFIDKTAKNPLIIFDQTINEQTFTSALFLVLSSLPMPDLNGLLINLGSYLPQDLDEVNEDQFKLNVRTYLTTSTLDLHELFKKIRLVLKLYFGKQRQIIAIIVKEKTKEYFKKLLDNHQTRKLLETHLQETAENQFQVRIKILEGLVKIL